MNDEKRSGTSPLSHVRAEPYSDPQIAGLRRILDHDRDSIDLFRLACEMIDEVEKLRAGRRRTAELWGQDRMRRSEAIAKARARIEELEAKIVELESGRDAFINAELQNANKWWRRCRALEEMISARDAFDAADRDYTDYMESGEAAEPAISELWSERERANNRCAQAIAALAKEPAQ